MNILKIEICLHKFLLTPLRLVIKHINSYNSRSELFDVSSISLFKY